MSNYLTRSILPFALLLLTLAAAAIAQSSTATLSGTVQDENSAVIPGSRITVTNPSTGLERTATTNDSGSFTIPLLPPGEYTVLVEREGFTRVQLTNIVLNVGDQKAVQVQLKVGDVASTVEVRPDASLITTRTDVSTVIDQQLVRNIPLNGRSFQSLFELTPGVVLVPTGPNQLGQFSVNGQRTNANYVMVDGVSANTGIATGVGGVGPAQSGSGTAIGFTAQGTTTSLVSVDALQEFRIQTSTYAPEFGRVPGGQISLITKSGTNEFHGTLFEYFRNEAFDANDWFNNRNRLRRPPTRQNQFGGTIGGPLPFLNFGDGGGPLFNSGKNRTFFFFSYEGLRLLQPQAAEISVPTIARRQATLPTIQPYLNALPIPNGRDNGNGTAVFASTWSNKEISDATAIRIDHAVTNKLSVFGRFSNTPSFSKTRTGSSFSSTSHQDNTYLTIGSTWLLSDRAANDLRVNFARTKAPNFAEPDTFGGAVLLPTTVFASGNSPDNAFFSLSVLQGGSLRWGKSTNHIQRQFNIVDSVTYNLSDHNLKFGADFRRMNPTFEPSGIGFESLIFTLPNVSNPTAFLYQRFVNAPAPSVIFDNLSLYSQDNWKATSRLTLTYGLRWEFVPPPHTTEGRDAISLVNMDNPFGGQVHVAPQGTPLWEKRYNNFAPRLGASYLLLDGQGKELVLRGGFGVFHDLGYGIVSSAYTSYPFTAGGATLSPAFPINLPPPVLGVGRPSQILTVDPNLELPYTLQWNVAAEKAFGPHQTLTVSYVGAAGKKLIKADAYSINLQEWPAPQFAPITVVVMKNNGYSDYRALQLQFHRRLHRHLQSLVAYTFGRSHDTASTDALSGVLSEQLPINADYGYSSYDIRHVFTAAVTFEMPKPKGPAIWKAIARDWGVDAIFRARSGLPIDIRTLINFPQGQSSIPVRPNVIPDVPIWIDDPEAPGGRRLNTTMVTPAQAATAGCVAPTASNAKGAFCTPPIGTQGNLPRNSIRGFAARQLDISLHRAFPFSESARLQLQIDAFNVTNTPNFATPEGSLSNGNFGRSTQMLGRGLGGLNALYQIGGSRSIQLSAKLYF